MGFHYDGVSSNFYSSIEIARFCGYLSINHNKYDDKQTEKKHMCFIWGLDFLDERNIKSAHLIRVAGEFFFSKLRGLWL